MRLCQCKHALVCNRFGVVAAAQAEQARADQNGESLIRIKIVFPGSTILKAVFLLRHCTIAEGRLKRCEQKYGSILGKRKTAGEGSLRFVPTAVFRREIL
jgi:hypothetical protein